jgi:TorA maturation chaperone TorD
VNARLAAAEAGVLADSDAEAWTDSTSGSRQGQSGEGTVGLFRAAVAGDLRALALLHDRELDAERILALWQDAYEDFLGLRLVGEVGRRSLGMLRAGLTDIPSALGRATLDQLAADFADIYLTHALRASPCESVWLDEDGLVMQAPMFDLRTWYARHGLGVADWRKRSDDHLVHQLSFLAHLLAPEVAEAAQAEAGPGSDANLAEAARFLDEHLLLWIDRFAERVASRCQTRLYAGLALLTAAYLDELRDLLADVAQVPRPTQEEVEARRRPRPALSVAVRPPSPFVPGTGPTW